MMRYSAVPLLAWPVAALLATGCGANAEQPVRNAVIGQVLDEAGRPIVAAEVGVRYQSNPGGVSISRSARTDRQGRYRIDLTQPPGVWTAHAQAQIQVDGKAMLLDLEPDDATPFAGNAGAVRNFRLRYSAGSAENPYGTGGMIVVASAIGDYTPLDEVVVLLQPVAGGPVTERRLRSTGEGWVITGLAPQAYRVAVRHGGQPLLVSPALTPQTDYRWGPEHQGGFERTGPGIYQLRIEVKAP